MAHFQGTVEGNRGEASRLGSKASGLHAALSSWQGRVAVDLWHDEKTGRDWAKVYLTTHINGRGATPSITVYHGPIDGDPKGSIAMGDPAEWEEALR
jgi:hypothetical protein